MLNGINLLSVCVVAVIALLLLGGAGVFEGHNYLVTETIQPAWQLCGSGSNPQSAEEENLTTAFGLFDGSSSDFSFAVLPALDIQCEAPLQFGRGTPHCANYQGWYLYEQIDAVNVYNSGLSILDSALVFAEQRTQTPHALSITADTRFYVNDGSGNIIYSHDSQHSGQINPLYEWAPEDHLIQHEGDIRLRMRGFPGAPMYGK